MHCNIGGSGQLCTGISPFDPIFWYAFYPKCIIYIETIKHIYTLRLLHSFIDFSYAFWQTCHGYDLVNPYTHAEFSCCAASSSNPAGSQCCTDAIEYCGADVVSHIEAEIQLPILANASWTSFPTNQYKTFKHVYDLQSLSISYDYGDFDVATIQGICGRTLNESWFFDTYPADRRRLGANGKLLKRKADFIAEKISNDKYKEIMTDVDGKERFSRSKSKLWAKIMCQEDQKRFNHTCEYPKYFYNCNDLKPDEITLRELILRVKGNKCMINTRKKYYKFAKGMSNLHALCNGLYDTFCDKDKLFSLARDKPKILREKGDGTRTAVSYSAKKETTLHDDIIEVNRISKNRNTIEIDIIYVYIMFGISCTLVLCLMAFIISKCIRYAKRIGYRQVGVTEVVTEAPTKTEISSNDFVQH